MIASSGAGAGAGADTGHQENLRISSTETIREEGLDKFYTIPEIAKRCLEHIGSRYSWSEWTLVVEPSAGNGSFLTQIPVESHKLIGIDISPEHPDILKQDFLTYTPPPSSTSQNILVVGNPPFGKVSSLAIKFFNHSSRWANVIAFIVPRTFRRISVQNKLNRQFHLVFDEDTPTEPCSFYPPMMAKCCFQIWEKRIISSSSLRPIVILPMTHPDWDFVKMGSKDSSGQPTPPTTADFALRAYGGKCGDIVESKSEMERLRPKSWHWIQSKIDIRTLIERFRSLDYTLSMDTARQNSIGKGELVRLYSETYD